MLRTLLRLYPRALRVEFEEEMLEVAALRLGEAAARGRSAWLRALGREAASFLGDALEARRLRPPLGLLAAVLLAAAAGHLITGRGLFHPAAWLLLVAGLPASGMAFGARRMGIALFLALATVPGSAASDRALLPLLERGTLRVPGVRYDVARADAAEPLLAELRAARAPRVRVAVRQDGLVTAVRTGGVDGAWILACLALLGAGAAAGRRWRAA